jgi:hypothetical protein
MIVVVANWNDVLFNNNTFALGISLVIEVASNIFCGHRMDGKLIRGVR